MSFLIVEFLVLFVGLPLCYLYSPWRFPPLPLLWAAAAYCVIVMKRAGLPAPVFRPDALPSLWPSLPIIFVIVAGLIALGVWRFAPHFLFTLPRRKPRLWLLIMALYPVLSVYPQGIIYRAFLMERYQQLFPSPLLMVLVSATVFGFMHVVFRNWVAVSLTFIGGLLFAWRFQHTGSMAASSLEHALYGCFMFTIGLEQSLYHGTFKFEDKAVKVVAA